MLDEASRQRLLEMGIDVYVPRAAQGRADIASISDSVARSLDSATAADGAVAHARVILLARMETAASNVLLDDVRRGLAFAGVDGVLNESVDLARIGDAAGVVVFGKALAREAGGAVPADRAKALQWASTADLASMAANAAAKRGLWVELRRLVRALRARGLTDV